MKISTPVFGLLFTLFWLQACSKKPPESLVDYQFNLNTQELIANIKLPEGMHAYGPGESIGKPLELIIESKNKWVLAEAPHIPTGDNKHLLHSPFQVKAKLKNGQGTIFGILKMQLCSDTACERPQEYPFQIVPTYPK